MGRGKHAARSIVLAVAAVGVAACAAGGADGSTSAAGDGASAVTSATRTPRIVDDSGRPPVTFDPCLDIPDEILTEAGYDPRTEDSADYPMGDYTFLGCSYRGTHTIPEVLRRYGLGILSGNVTLDEELAKKSDISTEITINGRRSLLEADPNANSSCVIALETSFGIVLFDRLYHKDHAREITREERCAGLEDTVTQIEVFIDD